MAEVNDGYIELTGAETQGDEVNPTAEASTVEFKPVATGGDKGEPDNASTEIRKLVIHATKVDGTLVIDENTSRGLMGDFYQPNTDLGHPRPVKD